MLASCWAAPDPRAQYQVSQEGDGVAITGQELLAASPERRNRNWDNIFHSIAKQQRTTLAERVDRVAAQATHELLYLLRSACPPPRRKKTSPNKPRPHERRPLAPLALAVWTSVGANYIFARLPEHVRRVRKQVICMDDRPFTSLRWDDIRTQIDAWQAWSDEVNLRENGQKTQVTTRGRDADIHACPEQWRKAEVKMLGCHSVSQCSRTFVQDERTASRKARRGAELFGKIGLPSDILVRAGQSLIAGMAPVAAGQLDLQQRHQGPCRMPHGQQQASKKPGSCVAG